MVARCRSLSPRAVEAELFGHGRGVADGAPHAREGLVQLADGGTLLLAEVGRVPPGLQVKVLRVLEDGEFERVGEGRTRKVDVRVIATSTRDLAADVEEGRMQSELYYRLSVFPIEVPALRERREDLPLLAAHFLAHAAAGVGSDPPVLTPAELDVLRKHDWPGNVRELRNAMERAVLQAASGEVVIETAIAIGNGIPTRRRRPRPAPEVEKAAIEEALARTGGVVLRAARELGMTRPTLYRRMKELGVAWSRGARP